MGTKGWMALSEAMASALLSVELTTMASYAVRASIVKAPLASMGSTVYLSLVEICLYASSLSMAPLKMYPTLAFCESSPTSSV